MPDHAVEAAELLACDRADAATAHALDLPIPTEAVEAVAGEVGRHEFSADPADWLPRCSCGWAASKAYDVDAFDRHVAEAVLTAALPHLHPTLPARWMMHYRAQPSETGHVMDREISRLEAAESPADGLASKNPSSRAEGLQTGKESQPEAKERP